MISKLFKGITTDLWTYFAVNIYKTNLKRPSIKAYSPEYLASIILLSLPLS